MHPMVAVLAAIAIVLGIIGAYVWVNYQPPVHTGQVLSVSAYPIHRELSTGSGLGGISGGNNVYDEVIVIANVRIKSQTKKLPLFLSDMYGDVTLPDGIIQESRAAGPSDFRKVFVAYPELASQQKTPVARDITLSPGQEIEGQIIFHYPITEQQWKTRKDFSVVVRFIHQKDLVLHATSEGTGTAQR